jgi:hypothetical protein
MEEASTVVAAAPVAPAEQGVVPPKSASPAEAPISKNVKSDHNEDVAVAQLRVGTLPAPDVPSHEHRLQTVCVCFCAWCFCFWWIVICDL